MSARSRSRRALPIIAVVVGAILVALVAGAPRNDGVPLDPRSSGEEGTRALMLLLRERGATVNITQDVPTDPNGVALVLRDNLDTDQREALAKWVRAGGTLVVADSSSDLAGVAGFDSTVEGDLEPECSLPPVAGIDHIEVPGSLLYRIPIGGTGCFTETDVSTRRTSAFLVARGDGEGSVIALGSADPFVNAQLGDADNSVLAVGLLAPKPGGTVTVLEPPTVGEGDKSLGDLVSPRVIIFLVELILAFCVFAWWRARRLGRPVMEPVPVELAGSELVAAVGNLLQQGERREQAAEAIRADLRRTLSERLSLGADVPPDVVADVASARTGVDRDTLLQALRTDTPATDTGLVALAQAAEAVHQEVIHAR